MLGVGETAAADDEHCESQLIEIHSEDRTENNWLQVERGEHGDGFWFWRKGDRGWAGNRRAVGRRSNSTQPVHPVHPNNPARRPGIPASGSRHAVQCSTEHRSEVQPGREASINVFAPTPRVAYSPGNSCQHNSEPMILAMLFAKHPKSTP